ncbi:MAG: hypothetical protein II471_09400 [Bacteroidales bacterium]|nr:hypothetical protein [Bacteroidales bacterium]
MNRKILLIIIISIGILCCHCRKESNCNVGASVNGYFMINNDKINIKVNDDRITAYIIDSTAADYIGHPYYYPITGNVSKYKDKDGKFFSDIRLKFVKIIDDREMTIPLTSAYAIEATHQHESTIKEYQLFKIVCINN